jgi:hypothetical protein
MAKDVALVHDRTCTDTVSTSESSTSNWKTTAIYKYPEVTTTQNTDLEVMPKNAYTAAFAA